MKKFTILMCLVLATVITGSAFAQSVTLTAEQVEKIEAHIIGLDKQISELTRIKEIQANAIKELTKKNLDQAKLLKQKMSTEVEVLKVNCKLYEELVNGKCKRKIISSPVKMSNSGICHTPGSTYYSRTHNYKSYTSLSACLNAGGRRPKN
jgi:hypothetical protein